jgi:integrase/recombinase XerD
MNPPPAKTRHSAVAGFFSKRLKELTPNPPPRHGNHGATLSAKTGRLIEQYEEDASLRFSSHTLRGYLFHVRAFTAWLAARGIELSSVRTSDLLAHQAELAQARKKDGKPYSVGNQQKSASALKSFFRFLVKRSFMLQDPAAALEMPKGDARLPRVILTKDEMAKLLESVKGRSPRALRDRAILETLYATGIRAGELVALTPGDVDTTERTLRVILGKGRKGRMVPLTHAAARAIEAYLAHGRAQLLRHPSDPWLFVSDWGVQCRDSTLNVMIQNHARRAGLKKRVTCHTFRHSVATHLLKGRADIRHIQVLLGHRSLQSTERYTRVEIADLREVVRRAHPRGR